MNTVIQMTTGTKLVYANRATIPQILLSYRATVVGKEWRGKRRVLTLYLPNVLVTHSKGGVLHVVFPEFKDAIDLACDDDPIEIWNIRNGKDSRRYYGRS